MLLTITINVVVTIIGYYLGELTCSSHLKTSGFWITLLVFIVVNGLHSLIDGFSLIGMNPISALGLMLGHEVWRQLILYALFFAMITPFAMSKQNRFLAAFGAITLVWVLFAFIGSQFGNQLSELKAFEPYVPYLKYLFIGDIIHHLADYWEHRKKPVPVKS